MYLTLQDNPSERNYYRLVVERLLECHKGDSVMWVSTFNDDNVRHSISGDSIDLRLYSLSLTYDDPVFQPDIPSLDYNGAHYRGIFSDDLFNGKEYTVTFSLTPNNSFVTVPYLSLSITIFIFSPSRRTIIII